MSAREPGCLQGLLGQFRARKAFKRRTDNINPNNPGDGPNTHSAGMNSPPGPHAKLSEQPQAAAVPTAPLFFGKVMPPLVPSCHPSPHVTACQTGEPVLSKHSQQSRALAHRQPASVPPCALGRIEPGGWQICTFLLYQSALRSSLATFLWQHPHNGSRVAGFATFSWIRHFFLQPNCTSPQMVPGEWGWEGDAASPWGTPAPHPAPQFAAPGTPIALATHPA